MAFSNIKTASPIYPSLGMKKAGEHLRINFGQFPFVFDIDHLLAKEKGTIYTSISQTPTFSLLRPGTTETAEIQKLVAQYLAHDGYVETARAFAEEVRQENKGLNQTGSGEEGVAIGVEEDSDAINRQRTCPKKNTKLMSLTDIDNRNSHSCTYWRYRSCHQIN